MVNRNGPIESNVPSSLPRGHGNRDRGGRPDLVVRPTNEPYSCGTAPDLSGGQIHRLRLLYLPIRGFRYLNRDLYDLKGALTCEGHSNTAFQIAA
jgi:hypothetical protein